MKPDSKRVPTGGQPGLVQPPFAALTSAPLKNYALAALLGMLRLPAEKLFIPRAS
jgi:hypothetical protein